MFLLSAFTGDSIPKKPATQIDEALIPRIGQGDEAAFEKLYDQASNIVFAYAFSQLAHKEDAEDILQDTFIKIHSAAHLYRPEGKPLAWILTITKNLCRMHFRQAGKNAAYPEDDHHIPDDLDRITNAEDRMLLEAAFEILSPEDRQIILLHAVSGMRHRELADLFSLPLSTVLSRYNRGLRKLRKHIGVRL